MTSVELVGLGAVVIAILAFALLSARLGVRALTRGTKRGAAVRLLPWWYIGGQPDAPIAPPDLDDDGDDEPRLPPAPQTQGTGAGYRVPVGSGRERDAD